MHKLCHMHFLTWQLKICKLFARIKLAFTMYKFVIRTRRQPKLVNQCIIQNTGKF